MPPRAAFAHSQDTRSGTVAPMARDSFSTHALVSSYEYRPRSMGIQAWMPRDPVVLA